MAPRIKLFQTERPKSLQMVFEDMQTTVLEIEASALENPNIAPANTPEEEALLEVVIADNEKQLTQVTEVVETSLPAIGALEDTAYGIAPSIKETRPTDIALVRQIATTAGDALGIDPDELSKGVDDSMLGQPLVLEGFKEKIVLATRAVWNAIVAIFDHIWTFAQSMFRRTGARMEKLSAACKVKAGAYKDTEVKSTQAMWALTNYGGLKPSEIDDSVKYNLSFLRLNMMNFNTAVRVYGDATAVFAKAHTAADIPKVFATGAETLLAAYAQEIRNSKVFEVKGADMVSVNPINGKHIKLVGMGEVQNLLKTDVLKAVAAFSGVTISSEEISQSAALGSDLEASYQYQAADFYSVVRAISPVFENMRPAAINQVGLVSRNLKRTVQTLSDRLLVNWASLIDAAPEAEQAAYKPYFSAVSQLINKHATLTTQMYTKGIHLLDTMVTGSTQLLEQGLVNIDDKK